jgi:RNA polymerase sigma factor (sigma-70 family)
MTTSVGIRDEESLALAIAGDEAAFTRIVAAHHASMTKVAYLVCADLDLADEAVASAWVIAWRRIDTVRDADRLGSWLATVAANEARQLARRRRRRAVREIQLDADEQTDDPRYPTAADPASQAPDLDLEHALAGLDPDDRALLALRYVAGLNATELGRATGRSASGTRARLARLLARLRTELADDD